MPLWRRTGVTYWLRPEDRDRRSSELLLANVRLTLLHFAFAVIGALELLFSLFVGGEESVYCSWAGRFLYSEVLCQET